MTGDVDLFSVRMRATNGATIRDGGHLSGGERMVSAELVDDTKEMLMTRALRAGASAGAIRISVSRIPAADITVIPALPITTVDAAGPAEAIAVAREILSSVAVAQSVIDRAFARIRTGPVYSGAALVHLDWGDESCGHTQGVRLSRLDFTPAARFELQLRLEDRTIPHSRTIDALAIASKAIWAGAAAELCWSDDRQYVAGYVATKRHGYVRFPFFKPDGAAGGRVLFGHWTNPIGDHETVLRLSPVLVDSPIIVNPPISPRAFLREVRR